MVDKKPILGLVGVPKKKQLFYSYAVGQSFIKENGNDKKIECMKKDDRKTTNQILLKTFVVKEKISLFARIHCKTKTPCRAIHIKSVIIYVQTSLVHLWTMGGKK